MQNKTPQTKQQISFLFKSGGGLPGGTHGKEPACQCRRCKRLGFNSWVRKIPWRMKWQPTLEFLPGESHGQKSLVGYSARGRRELDMTEQLNKKKEQCSL